LHKALLPIFLIIVVDILGMAIILPLLPFYAEHMGATPTEVGLLVSTFAVCQLIGGPLLGRLSDHTGRKPLLIVSQIGTLIGFVMLAYAGSLWVVFLSRVIDGITAGNISLAQAYIADVTKPEERTKSFALIGIAFGLGFLVGPAVGGFLSQYGYQAPVFLAIALSALSIFATIILLPATKTSPDSQKRFTVLDWQTYAEYFRRDDLGPLLWQFFGYIFAFSAFMAGFPLFAERRFFWEGKPFGPREVGYVYGYLGVIGVIIQGGLIGPTVKRFGDEGLVRIGLIFSVVGFALLGWTFGVGPLVAVVSVLAVATTVVRPAITSLITQIAGRSEQGGALGLMQALQSIAQILAPALSGFIINHGWLGAWALMAAAASVLALMTRKAPASA
jgi:MFS transporter, DHA1 family, tetracycline resistance protein